MTTENFTSTPYARTHEPWIITQLRIQGYDVKEKDNEYYVNGVKISKNEPVFEAVKRIKLAEIKNDSKKFANFYHARYNKIVEEIKIAKQKDNLYTDFYQNFRKKFYSILSWNNAKKTDDITNVAQRELAEEYETNKNNFKAMHTRESNNIYSLAMEGTSAALSAAKFEFDA